MKKQIVRINQMLKKKIIVLKKKCIQLRIHQIIILKKKNNSFQDKFSAYQRKLFPINEIQKLNLMIVILLELYQIKKASLNSPEP